MPETLLRTVASEWREGLRLVGAPLDAPVIVAGERPDVLGDALHRAGGPPVAFSNDAVAVLGDGDTPDMSVLTDAPPGGAGLVVLHHAWSGRTGIQKRVDEAVRATRPGGTVVVADLDVERLAEAPPDRYPSVLLYRLRPDLLAAVRSRHGTPSDLSMAALRSGLRSLREADLAVTRRHNRDRVAYASAVPPWRGAVDDLDDGAIKALLADLGTLVRRSVFQDGVWDREPWHLVAGTVPV